MSHAEAALQHTAQCSVIALAGWSFTDFYDGVQEQDLLTVQPTTQASASSRKQQRSIRDFFMSPPSVPLAKRFKAQSAAAALESAATPCTGAVDTTSAQSAALQHSVVEPLSSAADSAAAQSATASQSAEKPQSDAPASRSAQSAAALARSLQRGSAATRPEQGSTVDSATTGRSISPLAHAVDLAATQTGHTSAPQHALRYGALAQPLVAPEAAHKPHEPEQVTADKATHAPAVTCAMPGTSAADTGMPSCELQSSADVLAANKAATASIPADAGYNLASSSGQHKQLGLQLGVHEPTAAMSAACHWQMSQAAAGASMVMEADEAVGTHMPLSPWNKTSQRSSPMGPQPPTAKGQLGWLTGPGDKENARRMG